MDPFLGSGSTLVAAEKSGRVCRGVEFDPLYVGVILRRFEAAPGKPAVLAETGEAFEAFVQPERGLGPRGRRSSGTGDEPDEL